MRVGLVNEEGTLRATYLKAFGKKPAQTNVLRVVSVNANCVLKF